MKPLYCNIVFYSLLLFIWVVAAIDTYWSIKLQDSLLENELNPVGKWLIQMDNGSVALFMSLKLFGTSFVTSFLILFSQWSLRLGMAVLTGVSMGMMALLTILYS